jgi:hypothetical protein
MIKIGVDIHGVATDQAEFFRELTALLVSSGNEVHILTGPPLSIARAEADALGLTYTHIFSITDHHVQSGTSVVFDSKGHPHMDEYLWDKTKAEYCLKHDINLHLDDTDAYGYFFKTPFARYYSKTKRDKYVKET